jgi:hypothetical protein
MEGNGKRIYCLMIEVYLRWEDLQKTKDRPPGRQNDSNQPRWSFMYSIARQEGT